MFFLFCGVVGRLQWLGLTDGSGSLVGGCNGSGSLVMVSGYNGSGSLAGGCNGSDSLMGGKRLTKWWVVSGWFIYVH